MGSGEKWQDKFRRLMLAATGKSKPIKVVPRRSGPVEVPHEWWSPAYQEKLLPQCVLCHERVLPGEPLKRGLCGSCWLRTSETGDAA